MIVANAIIVWLIWAILMVIPTMIRPQQAKYEVSYLPIVSNITSLGGLIGEVIAQWIPTALITYAFMTKGILALLNKLSFDFKAIGDPVDYHGIRTPCLGEIEKITERLSVNNPELYAEFNSNI